MPSASLALISRATRPGVPMTSELGGISLPSGISACAPIRRATLERELGRPIAPLIVKLDASDPDGYERVWRTPVAVGPGRHIAYAVQWFAFAATAVILFFIVSFRTQRP